MSKISSINQHLRTQWRPKKVPKDHIIFCVEMAQARGKLKMAEAEIRDALNYSHLPDSTREILARIADSIRITAHELTAAVDHAEREV